MSFGFFNRAWIEEMLAQQDQIRARRAIEKVQSFLEAQQAHKTPILPIPLSFDRDAFERLASAGRLLMAAQTKILRHLCQTHSRADLLRMFHIPEVLVPFVDWQELLEGRHVVSRFDVVPSNDGFYFCELNRDSSVGGIEVADCLAVYCEAMGWPLTQGWDPPAVLTARLLGKVVEQKDLRRIVICDWSTNRGNGYFGYDRLLHTVTRELPGVEIHLVYENEYSDAWLKPEEGRRTLTYRGFMHQDMNDQGAFFRRLWDSGATIINTCETELRMNKGWFAMYGDQRYRSLLADEEIAAIERHVPRTVALNRDNLEQVLADKDELAFKLGLSSGGEGVLMGADHTAGELRALIEAKGTENWSAQQAIVFDGLDMPYSADFEPSRHNVVLGLYLIDGHASGLTVAASSSTKVVNIHSGVAGYTWAVPMTPDEQARHLAHIRNRAKQ